MQNSKSIKYFETVIMYYTIRRGSGENTAGADETRRSARSKRRMKQLVNIVLCRLILVSRFEGHSFQIAISLKRDYCNLFYGIIMKISIG